MGSTQTVIPLCSPHHDQTMFLSSPHTTPLWQMRAYRASIEYTLLWGKQLWGEYVYMYACSHIQHVPLLPSSSQPARQSLASLVLECQWPPWRKCLWKWERALKRPWRTGTYVGGVRVLGRYACCLLSREGLTTVVYIWCKELCKLHVLFHATSHVLQGDSNSFTTRVPNLPAGWSCFLGLH